MSTFYNDLKEFADDIKRQFDTLINNYSDLVYSPEKSYPGAGPRQSHRKNAVTHLDTD